MAGAAGEKSCWSTAQLLLGSRTARNKVGIRSSNYKFHTFRLVHFLHISQSLFTIFRRSGSRLSRSFMSPAYATSLGQADETTIKAHTRQSRSQSQTTPARISSSILHEVGGAGDLTRPGVMCQLQAAYNPMRGYWIYTACLPQVVYHHLIV